jgi:hypothetical protein
MVAAAGIGNRGYGTPDPPSDHPIPGRYPSGSRARGPVVTGAAPRRVVKLADLRPEVAQLVRALLAQTRREPAAVAMPAGSETGGTRDADRQPAA